MAVLEGLIGIGARFHDDRKGAVYMFRASGGSVHQSADADGSGVIDVADFVVFVDIFGQSVS